MAQSDGLTGLPVASVEELVDRLAAIDAALPPDDGLACFNRMYRLVTESVAEQLAADFFADPVWMRELDLSFANLYLDAVRAWIERSERVPRAWAALLERRDDGRIAPLQFALAGMNAHINRDLPVAVVLTCAALGSRPDEPAHYADFARVNSVLADAEPAIRRAVSDAFLQAADRLAPGVQDVVANFNIYKARETAWRNANTLWALRHHSPVVEAEYLDALDHLVGFAGRGLLVPLSG